MTPITHVVDNSLIETAWGNSVADAINSGVVPTYATVAARDTASPAATTPAGSLCVVLTPLTLYVATGTTWAPANAQGVITAPRLGTASLWTNATAVYSDITVSAGVAPTMTLALDTARRYRFKFATLVQAANATDRVGFGLNVNGTVVAEMLRNVTNSAAYADFEAVLVPASAAAIVYKMQGRGVGGGAIGLTPVAAGQPMSFYVEDVGPS